MKCVVGIDLEGRCSSAVALLGRLKFEKEETLLIHATEPLALTLGNSAYGVLIETQEILETLRNAGQKALDDANQQALEAGLHPTTMLSDGFPTQSLLDWADGNGTNLIAVGSTVRSPGGAIFGGSVARGLSIAAKQSILVAREELPTEGPFKVVFASDQSRYCEECIQLLAEMAPEGISHMTLLTVLDAPKHKGLLSYVQHVDSDAALEAESASLGKHAEFTAHCLSEKGIPTSSLVVAGRVEESIHRVMVETAADLLIVGAQGHGFFDRLFVGSTSLHQVVAESYPVLILRPAARPNAVANHTQ